MWFQTAHKTNQNIMNNLRFIPTQVLEMWECKKCMNIIFNKKYTFSPFPKKDDLFGDSWSLENVIVKIEENYQLEHIEAGSRNQKFIMMNEVKIYCKICDQKLLGKFQPLINFQRSQLKYKFICCDENIKKTKIIMGKSNISEISRKSSKILKQNNSIDNLTVLRQICYQINKYVALWYYSKNFKIYQPFISESKNNRQYLMSMKGFMMKTKSRNQTNEKESLRLRFKQNSCSNNSAELTV